MHVIIYTDAAYNKEYKRASFAYWITTKEGRFKNSGSVNIICENSDVAELSCITEAFADLIGLLESGKISHFNKLILYTDSQNSINLLSKNEDAIRKFRLNKPCHKQAMVIFKNNVTRRMQANGYDIYIDYRHVRSHSGTDTTRQFINDWCDRRAKLELTKTIRKHLKNNLNAENNINW